jgi:hypothetical protein
VKYPNITAIVYDSKGLPLLWGLDYMGTTISDLNPE